MSKCTRFQIIVIEDIILELQLQRCLFKGKTFPKDTLILIILCDLSMQEIYSKYLI